MKPWFTQHFSRFLRLRRARAHFGRRPLPGVPVPPPGVPKPPAPPPGPAPAPAAETLAAALARLGSAVGGLDEAQAARRLAEIGPNELAHEPPLPAWLHLWRSYFNPFNVLLSVLAALSALGGQRASTLVIVLMVALGTVIRDVQEGRSRRAADGLRAQVGNTASVVRRAPAGTVAEPRPGLPAGSVLREVPLRELVPGDWVALSAGDMVPADGRLVSARDLYIDQAAMTGEALPVLRQAEPDVPAAGGPAAAPDPHAGHVFLGTNVVSGTALVLVEATGARTGFGQLAAHVLAADVVPNAFETGVNAVSWLLIRFALVMVPIVAVVSGLVQGDAWQALLFALSVAVGLTPEMLPMIVTSTLAKGAVALARRQVVVKRLDAIQNLGAMELLCTDKTGTLTQDRIALARHADAQGCPSEAVLHRAFLNSHYQTGLKNLLDRAVLAHVPAATAQALRARWQPVDELPFDFQRRRMSVRVAQAGGPGPGGHLLVCKGAVDEVLAVCTRVAESGGLDEALPGDPDTTGEARDAAAGPGGRTGPATQPLDADRRATVRQRIDALQREGLRVVLVAGRALAAGSPRCTVADEAGLTLWGWIAFFDPPRESAAPALRALAAHGIAVKVLTGDHELVTAQVARLVGLAGADEPVLLGEQVQALDDAQLLAAAQAHTLMARLTPMHKERIVRVLRASGRVVGFLGDGINDAPALRAADVGISVNSAVDIAKEAADIILLEKSLLVLDDGVVEGRRTFANLLKYIRMTASSNFGNVLSVLVASAFLPFLPMRPLQLLVQNLLYDIGQTGIPFDRVDASLLARPLKWRPQDIGRFMRWFGPASSVFDLATFAFLWWGLGLQDVAQQGVFQSAWFMAGLLTQTLVVHLLRTPGRPFIDSRAAAPLTVMTLLIAALGLVLPFSPLAPWFELQAVPPVFYAWLLLMVAGQAVLTTVLKHHYIRRYGWH